MGQRILLDCLRTHSPDLQLRLLSRRNRMRLGLGGGAE